MKAIELPAELQPIQTIKKGDISPLTGYVMGRPVLERFMADRMGYQECREYMLGQCKEDHTDFIIIGLTLVFGFTLGKVIK